MKLLKLAPLLFVCLFVFSTYAQPIETQPPTAEEIANILAAPNQTIKSLAINDKTIVFNAVGIVTANSLQAFEKTIDYNHYADMGLPGVKKAVELEASENHKVVWFNTSKLGQTVNFFIRANFNQTNKSEYITFWERIEKPAGALPIYNDSGKIASQNGFCYILDIGQNRIFVRYGLSTTLNVNALEKIIAVKVASSLATDGFETLLRVMSEK